MKKLKDVIEAVHPDALHVTPVTKDGKPHYKVKAVGKNFADGIKVGEHLTDTELDDFNEMGGKIKHIKESDDKETADDKEANKHIVVQLRKAADSGEVGADVTFANGETHKVKSEHAHKVLAALTHPGLKPDNKAKAAEHVGASHENFTKIHNLLK